MKATLEFQLPEEKYEFENACSGNDWAQIVLQLDNHLRNQMKHAPDTMSDDTHKALQDTRNKLHSLMQDYGVQFKN